MNLIKDLDGGGFGIYRIGSTGLEKLDRKGKGVCGGRYPPPFWESDCHCYLLYECYSRSFDPVSFFHRGMRHIVHSIQFNSISFYRGEKKKQQPPTFNSLKALLPLLLPRPLPPPTSSITTGYQTQNKKIKKSVKPHSVSLSLSLSLSLSV